MTWNNRILLHHHSSGDYYAVHEVYYDENGKPDSCTVEDIGITGDTVEDLMGSLERIYRDCHKYKDDILDYDLIGK